MLYRPDDPEFPIHAKIDSFGQLWAGAAILGGMGSLFFIVGVVHLLLIWKRVQIPFGKRWAYTKEIEFGKK